MNLVAAAKRVAMHSRLRNWIFYRYDFMFTPAQLGFLCDQLSSVASEGSVVEVGCAYGNTTVFLNRHMDAEGIERPYHCVDTFGGFLEEDLRVEKARGREWEAREFSTNDLRWFQTTMDINHIRRVTAWPGDTSVFDYARFAPVAFALIDVDLYRPVLNSLKGIWPHLVPGGLIVVDDCQTGQYEGALEAYREFCAATHLPEQIEHGKLGVLRRPEQLDDQR